MAHTTLIEVIVVRVYDPNLGRFGFLLGGVTKLGDPPI